MQNTWVSTYPSRVYKIFKASALWADAFYKSKCPSVCPSVCPCVCLSVCSLLRYRLTVFLPPLPKVGCQIFLEIRNPWRKSNGKKWSNIWTFLLGRGLKLPRIYFLFFLLIFPYKTWWKPRFQMDYRPLVEGCIANFGIFLDIFEFLRFGWFFPFFKKIGFLGNLGPPGNHASRWIRDLWSKSVSLIMAYF